jgi:hypothetical protein
MELEKFLEEASRLEKKKRKKEEVERLQKFFERFHLLNRKYLEKDVFEQARGSIPTIAEAVSNTIGYLDAEIARLRGKRSKLPFEALELSDIQKTQARNELLLKEYLAQPSD